METESNVIKPTVGRVVWFWPNGLVMPRHLVFHGDQPAKADVVYVHSDRMVNLLVVDHNGTAHPMTSVRLRQPDEERPGDGSTPFCEWMPYQKGQAVKTESMEPRVEQLEANVAEIAGTLEKLNEMLVRFNSAQASQVPPAPGT